MSVRTLLLNYSYQLKFLVPVSSPLVRIRIASQQNLKGPR